MQGLPRASNGFRGLSSVYKGFQGFSCVVFQRVQGLQGAQGSQKVQEVQEVFKSNRTVWERGHFGFFNWQPLDTFHDHATMPGPERRKQTVRH